jgi:hypothetical protein
MPITDQLDQALTAIAELRRLWRIHSIRGKRCDGRRGQRGSGLRPCSDDCPHARGSRRQGRVLRDRLSLYGTPQTLRDDCDDCDLRLLLSYVEDSFALAGE